jgi:hypothetical protein
VFAYQLGTGAAFRVDFLAIQRPGSFVCNEASERLAETRFLKAFAEEHLAVDAPIDLVIDVLNAGTGQIATDFSRGLGGIHANRDFRLGLGFVTD